MPEATTLGAAGSPVAVRAVCATAEATRALGRALGAQLLGGDVVVLDGPLGAGKTTFVQGLAIGLGVTDAVTSPTFVLARHQRTDPDGPRPDGPSLVHVDAYRLHGALELDDLDLDSDLDRAVVVVEWGAGLAERLSPSRVEVALARAAGADLPALSAGEGTGVDGSRVDGSRVDGSRVDGSRVEVSRVEGSHGGSGDGGSDEPRTVAVRVVGMDADRARRLTSLLRGLQEASGC